jgi:N-acetylglucosamine-6-phosphate deacetylase
VQAPTTVLAGGTVVTPHGPLRPGWVALRDGVIVALGGGRFPAGADAVAGPAAAGPVAVADLAGRWVLPGLIDLHNHGGGGGSFDVADPDAALAAVASHRRSGTTGLLASVVTAPAERMVAATATLADLAATATIAGIHLEGPFLAVGRCGAQDPDAIVDPDPGLLHRLLDAGRGHVRVVTVAPERPGALTLVRMLVDAGVVAAIGHSDAGYADAAAAIDAGATLATHLYNGMRPATHRDPGIVGACLDRREVHCELIADGHHLDPVTLRLAVRALPGRALLVSDATSATGRPDGVYRLGAREVVVEGGRAVLRGTDRLAGSVASLSSGLRHAVGVAGVDITEAVCAAATRPADLLGLGGGRITVGAPADLLILDEGLEPVAVYADGRPVERADPPPA